MEVDGDAAFQGFPTGSEETALELDEFVDEQGLDLDGGLGRRLRPAPTLTRQGIIVVGSHRSGTSALARVLSLAGCELPKHVMPPLAGSNELGFWEPEAVVQAHESFLASIGSSWDDVAPLPDGAFVSPAALELRWHLGLLLRDEYGNSPLLVVKDPRISRLLPLWHAVLAELQIAQLIVIAVRNPLEVAASLKARDGFTTTKALLLWLRHTLEAEHDSRGWPRSIVMYHDLLRDWRGVLTAVGQDLDISWPAASHRTGVEVERFLSGQHRHHVFGWEDVEGRTDVVSWVKDAYLALQTSNPEPVLDHVRSELARADTAFGPIVEEAQLALETSQEALRQTEEARDALATQVEARSAALETRVAETHRLQNEVERLTTAVAEAERAVAGRSAEVDALRAQRDAFAREVEVLAGELERVAGTAEAAQSRAKAIETETAAAHEKLTAARSEAERLRAAAEEAASRLSTLEVEAAAALVEADAERSGLLTQLEAARSREKELEARTADMGEELAAARGEIERLRAAVADAVSQAAAQRSEADAKRSRLLAKLNDARSRRKAVEAEMATARAELAEARSEADQSSAAAEDAASRVAELEAKSAAQHFESGAQRSRLLAKLETAQSHRRALENEIATSREELAEAQGEAERLRAAAEHGTLRLAELQAESAAQRIESDAQRSRLLEELESARADAGTARSEAELARSELAALQTEAGTERATLIAQRDAADQEAARLAAELEGARADASRLSGDNTELQLALDRHRGLLNALQPVTRRRTLRRRSLSQFSTWLLPPTPRKLNYVRKYLFLRWSGQFDVDSYLLANPDIVVAGINPLMHFVEYGKPEGRGLFGGAQLELAPPPAREERAESAADEAVLPEESATPASPAEEAGSVEADTPFADDGEPVFPNPDVLTDDLRQALETEFDRNYYLSLYGDVDKAGIDPLEHYFHTGWREGRDPSAHFSTSYYLASNPDIAAADLNPLTHYVRYGRGEGRQPHPPTGFKREALTRLRPLHEEVAQWQAAFPAPRVPMSAASLADSLAALIGTRRQAVVSCGHDDYRKIVGGVQLCVALEEAAFLERGCAYINLHPVRPLPVLSRATTPDALTLAIVCDGETVGIARADSVISALAGLGANSGIHFGLVIHALHGHSPEVIADLHRQLCPRWAWLWLHDFFGICPSTTLLRNKIEPCGAPHPESPGCTICVYGEERLLHAPRIRALLAAVPLKLVAPSGFMADRWRLYFGDEDREIRVHESGSFREVDPAAATPAAATAQGPARVAFLGRTADHKGWSVFLELVRRNAADDRYRFFHFGDGRYRAGGVELREVNVLEDRQSAVNALRAESIDLAVIWSLVEESFSFTAHEALSAGAAILTNENSGNVARMVSTSGQGIVFGGEHELFAAFERGSLRGLVESRRARAAAFGDFVHSRLTADFASFDD